MNIKSEIEYNKKAMKAILGSDDVIFDPERGYVKYGEVLNEYNAKMLEQLFNGSLPEDVQEYIRAYFAALYNGNKAEAE